MQNREETLTAIKKEMGRYFRKSEPSLKSRTISHSPEKRSRIRIREMVRSGEITAARAKKMLHRVTVKFTPFNNENNYLRG